MKYEEIIDFIKKQCNDKNISVYELSKCSDVPVSTLYGTFQGKNKAHIDTLNHLLNALNYELTIVSREQGNLKCSKEVLEINRLSQEKKELLLQLINFLK